MKCASVHLYTTFSVLYLHTPHTHQQCNLRQLGSPGQNSMQWTCKWSATADVSELLGHG
jgi:hypothetical protein